MREPEYVRAAAEIRDRIRSGLLRPGDRIPSEPDLMQTYGIARETARKAVEVLRVEGLVETVRGRGVMVRMETPVTVVRLHRGSRSRIRPATPEERAEHQLEPGARVLEVQRRYQPPGNHAPVWRTEVYPEDGHEFINS